MVANKDDKAVTYENSKTGLPPVIPTWRKDIDDILSDIQSTLN